MHNLESVTQKLNNQKLYNKWMKNLNIVTYMEKWECQYKKNIKFPKEKLYKMLHHSYIIPVMIANMSNSFLANCGKCSE